MELSSERVVVVTYDAASKGFAVNPNPVRLGPGNHKLYFALATANRGDAEPAVLHQVYEDNLLLAGERVGGCDQLWSATVVNETAADATTYNYTLRIAYAGLELGHDPSVVLEPPPVADRPPKP